MHLLQFHSNVQVKLNKKQYTDAYLRRTEPYSFPENIPQKNLIQEY